MKSVLTGLLVLLWTAPLLWGQQKTAGATLALSIPPQCSLTSQASSVERVAAGEEQWNGRIQFAYQLRTGKSSGGGSITAKLRGVPEGAAGTLEITAEIGGPGRNQEYQGAPSSLPLPLVIFGPNQHAAKAGEPGAVTWRLRLLSDSRASAPELSLDISCW